MIEVATIIPLFFPLFWARPQVQGEGFGVQGLVIRTQDSVFRIQGLVFRTQGSVFNGLPLKT